MALPLFDEPKPVVERIGIDDPRYQLWWRYLREGAQGQSFIFRDEDEQLMAFAKSGHRIGRLLSPLPCMKEKR